MSIMRHFRLKHDNVNLYPVNFTGEIPRFCGGIVNGQYGMNMIFVQKVSNYRDANGNDKSFVVYENDVSNVLLLVSSQYGCVCCLQYDVEFINEHEDDDE